MKRSRMFRTAVVVVVGMAFFFAPQEAGAALKIELQSGATTVGVEDNVGSDADATAGAVTFIGSIGSFKTVVATCISKPVLGDANLAQLDTSVVTATGGSQGSLSFICTDTDYFLGSSGGDTTFTTAVGGTTAGTTTFQSFIDTENTEYGTSGPTVCASAVLGPFGPGPFDGTVSAPCLLSGPMSLTFATDIQLGPNAVQSFGTSMQAARPQEPLGCRFTGGGVDTDGNWNHVLENGQTIRNGAGNLPEGIDRYQFGGQVGARTGQAPLPSGEWEHHQQTGPSGSFSFHGGTSSAPAGTQILDIRCSDPGYCFPARPAPCKQLDFDGIGTFQNLGNGASQAKFTVRKANAIPEPSGKRSTPFTFHRFEVNIDDLGEPGRLNSGQPGSAECPGRGFGEKSAGPYVPDPVGNPLDSIFLPFFELGNCVCPDFYRIVIYRGVLSTEVTYLPDGRIDPASLNSTDVIYDSFGYIDGGNLQLHPPTGFDLK